MALWDGPGTGSRKDVYMHSSTIRCGLECEPLNAIFVVVPYHVRADMMIDSYNATTSMLKEEDMHMTVPLISKMNDFVPVDDITEDTLKIYFAT